MCIVLVTRNKKYTIILSNRDEFLSRPTLRVQWWPSPHSNVLSGRDLARPTRGTWLGITRQGRLAVLTNFREETEQAAGAAAISRGEITKEFLVSEKPVEEWIAEVLETGVYKDVGGFSLMAGVLRKKTKGFAVVSNRSCIEAGGADYVLTEREEGVVGYECEGLSNSLYGDEWPKVKLGKKLLGQLREEEAVDEDEFIERCFELLSTNSFEKAPTVETLRQSIFIPKFVTPALPSIPVDHTQSIPACAVENHVSENHLPEWLATDQPRYYGTREQTVVLVDREDGRVVFTERTLWNEKGQALGKEQGQTRIEFHIEGWDEPV